MTKEDFYEDKKRVQEQLDELYELADQLSFHFHEDCHKAFAAIRDAIEEAAHVVDYAEYGYDDWVV